MKSDEAVLGGDVGGLVGAGDEAVHGRHIDDPPPSALRHSGQQALRKEERSGEHNAEHPLPLLVGELLDGRDVLNARVVDEDVRAAVVAEGLLGERASLVGVGEVGANERPADGVGDLAPGVAGVVDDDARALGGEAFGDSFADAARAARDQSRSAREFGHSMPYCA